jgi:hypothetical protein
MFYTLAGAVKATGLPELAILRALEGGEITGTKDLFGEWQIEHTELQGLYPPIAKRDANKDAVQDYVAIDATALEAEIGALIWQAGDSLRQQRENGPEPNTGGDQTQASQNLIAEPNHATLWSATSTITPAWDHSIRIDDRDKISVSVLAPAAPRSRTKTLPRPLPAPETRPTTIEGWTVRDVIDGTAVLQGPGGIWKAARGEMVPGLGRVDSIVLWGSRWIVATSKGLITTQ